MAEVEPVAPKVFQSKVDTTGSKQMSNVMNGLTVEGSVVFCEPIERYRVEGLPCTYATVIGVGGGTSHRFLTLDSYPVGTRLRVTYSGHNIVRIERVLS